MAARRILRCQGHDNSELSALSALSLDLWPPGTDRPGHPGGSTTERRGGTGLRHDCATPAPSRRVHRQSVARRAPTGRLGPMSGTLRRSSCKAVVCVMRPCRRVAQDGRCCHLRWSHRDGSIACKSNQAACFASIPCMISVSAICTAFRAAPLRRLSETHQNDSPCGMVGSLRIRLTNTASSPWHSSWVT
jgi:hypothetical protein